MWFHGQDALFKPYAQLRYIRPTESAESHLPFIHIDFWSFELEETNRNHRVTIFRKELKPRKIKWFAQSQGHSGDGHD